VKSTAGRTSAYVALSVIWGSTWIGTQILSRSVPPLRTGAVRFMIGALLLALLAVLRRSALPDARALRANLLLGFTIGALPYALVVWTSQHASSFLPVLLFAGLPLSVGLLGDWMQSSPVRGTAMQAELIGFGGVALLLSSGLSVSVADISGGLAIIAAVVSHAASLVYAKRLLRGSSLLTSIALQLGCASAVLWLASAIAERGHASQWNGQAAVAIVVLGVVGSGIGFLLYYWLLGTMEAYQIAALQWMVPLFAIGEGALAMRQWPTWSMVAGGAVTLGCLYALMHADVPEVQPVTLQVTD
jgi:drug/metabolite transporter (DMT)-like permease